MFSVKHQARESWKFYVSFFILFCTLFFIYCTAFLYNKLLYSTEFLNVFKTFKIDTFAHFLAETTISRYPEDTVVRVNSTAFFHCEASFNPTLDITYDWYHNDYHIQFIKVRIVGDLPYIEEEEHFDRVKIVSQYPL